METSTSTVVKFVEACHVAPPPGSGETTLTLTFYDLFWLRFPPTQRLFFYEHQDTDTFYQTILPKLKNSLSITLQHYLPLAGKIIWEPDSEKPVIRFEPDDGGVLFTVNESQADFHRLSGDEFRGSEELKSLLPDFPVTETKVPVFTLRLTLFLNKGFSIGYAAHHAATDGKTMSMFMHSWASVCRHGDITSLSPELVPFYDRTVVKDPDGKESKYLRAYLEHQGPDNRSLVHWDLKPSSDTMLGTVHISEDDIENLKRTVLVTWKGKSMEEIDVRLSTFTVVSAYIWVCLVRSQDMEPQEVHLAMSANARARPGSDPPIPPNYFGTCVTGIVAHASSEDLIGEDGVAIASKAIFDALKELKAQVVKEEAEKSDSGLFSMPKGKMYGIGGSPRFEHYKIDFGWGKPVKVELTSIDKTGAFSLSDPKDGMSGIDIGVTMKMHETEAFAALFASSIESH